ncbi:Phosphate-binding protein PstS [bacterium HR33]|nr:Phosphate-binding protein PstS [bacterium HR33]
MNRRFAYLAALAVAAGGCASGEGRVTLTGAGATFPNLIYQQWILDYNAANPGVQINYQSIGSGGGIRQFSDGTVDFGATDAPMTDSAIAAAGGNVIHLPTVLGAVVATYNLPGFQDTLRLTPEALSDIFLGNITRWNDPRIAAHNRGAPLPSTPIVVVHRSDGSGTTYVWTDYLSKVSEEWARRVGRGTSVAWPVGLGAKGNEGVMATVTQTPGAVGYVELGYALANRAPAAAIRNRAGVFVSPTIEAITAAARGAMETMGPGTDFRVSLTDPPGADAYPVASFTWVLVRREQSDSLKARALVEFLWWALTEGQKEAARLGYAPLPESLLPWIAERLAAVNVGGRPVWENPIGRP